MGNKHTKLESTSESSLVAVEEKPATINLPKPLLPQPVSQPVQQPPKPDPESPPPSLFHLELESDGSNVPGLTVTQKVEAEEEDVRAAVRQLIAANLFEPESKTEEEKWEDWLETRQLRFSLHEVK